MLSGLLGLNGVARIWVGPLSQHCAEVTLVNQSQWVLKGGCAAVPGEVSQVPQMPG